MPRSPRMPPLVLAVSLLLIMALAVTARNPRCLVDNCKVCSPFNSSVCALCKLNYMHTPSGTCVNYATCMREGCADCYISAADGNRPRCTACKRGYMMREDGKCKSSSAVNGQHVSWVAAGAALVTVVAATA